MGKRKITKELNRREFLKGAAAGAGGLALAGFLGNEARAHEASTPGKWEGNGVRSLFLNYRPFSASEGPQRRRKDRDCGVAGYWVSRHKTRSGSKRYNIPSEGNLRMAAGRREAYERNQGFGSDTVGTKKPSDQGWLIEHE